MADPGAEAARRRLHLRARSVSDWDTVRALAAGLPGVDESTSYGQPALKVKGKLFAWMSPNREAPGALALRVDPDEKQPILEAGRGAYFTVPHYDGYPIVLVHLDRIEETELRERIEDAWLLRAQPRLVAEHLAQRDD